MIDNNNMKNRRITLLFITSLLLLSGCSVPSSRSEEKPINPTDPTDPTDPIEPIDPIDPPEIKEIKNPNFNAVNRNSKEEFTYLDLFNLNNKVDVSIDVDRSELEKIQEDNNRGAKPEIYRLAKEVTISITNAGNVYTWTFDNVGIRQKGNTSRERIFYDENLNTHNHYKLSFDETFTEMYEPSFIEMYGDESRGDREFLGLSGLDFKWNRNSDDTHIKEIYANELYRSAGIIAQRVGLANLNIKYGTKVADFGLCFMYEQASKSLIKRNLSSNEEYINLPSWDKEKKGTYGAPNSKYGDFYKATYGRGGGYSNNGGDLTSYSISENRVGVKTDIYGNEYPAYERKTNKDETYHDELFKSSVNTINEKGYSEIEKVVDLDYFAIEEAVSYFVGNPDGLRYNYNNYMIYIKRVDGKMIFVPIDNDRTFGIGHTWDKGVSFSADYNVTPLSNKDVNWNTNRNPLFTKTIFSDTAAKEKYLEYIDLISKSSWVNKQTFKSLFDIAKSTYQNYASFSYSGGSDNMSFDSYIDIKLESVKR